jgi:hypothetical protein
VLGDEPAEPAATIPLAAREEPLSLELREFELRREMVQLVMPFFLKGNLWLFGFVTFVLLIDVLLLTLGETQERVVNSAVIIALISAMAAQLGAFVWSIGRHLFPSTQTRGQGSDEG